MTIVVHEHDNFFKFRICVHIGGVEDNLLICGEMLKSCTVDWLEVFQKDVFRTVLLVLHERKLTIVGRISDKLIKISPTSLR